MRRRVVVWWWGAWTESTGFEWASQYRTRYLFGNCHNQLCDNGLRCEWHLNWVQKGRAPTSSTQVAVGSISCRATEGTSAGNPDRPPCSRGTRLHGSTPCAIHLGGGVLRER